MNARDVANADPSTRAPLREWVEAGLLSPTIPPATIAAGYSRLYGVPAPRDPARKTSCAYSGLELLAVLCHLAAAAPAPPPPPAVDPLVKIWRRALRKMMHVRGRNFLRDHARLVAVLPGSPRTAVVEIDQPCKLPGSIAGDIGEALSKSLGTPVVVRVVALSSMPSPA